MTSKNTVLLIVRQNPGIDYNSLLGKVSAEYSNVNSARAALSRTIKDLSIFGFLERKNNAFFISQKGETTLNTEMKNKLVLKLNTSVKSNKQDSIEAVVETLSTLISRAKQDENLLKAAKTSSDFFISDLVELSAKTQKKISHLAYLEKVLAEQINYLKETNFNDKKKTSFENAVVTLKKIAQENNFSEIAAEVFHEGIKKILAEKFSAKFKDNTCTIKKEQLPEFFGMLEKETFGSHELAVFLPPIKVMLGSNEAFFVGPFSVINFV